MMPETHSCKRVIALLTKLFRAAYIPVPDYWSSKFPGWKEPFLTEYLSREGKALRPLLLLAGFIIAKRQSEGQSGDPSEEEIQRLLDGHPTVMVVAGALERFHAMLMAQDDIFDGGTERRGGKALHLLFADYARGKTFYRDDGCYLGGASPRAFVFDILLASTFELLQSLFRATNSRGVMVTPLAEFDMFAPLLSLSLRSYSDRGETVPLDYLFYQAQTMVEAIKMQIREIDHSDCPELLSLFTQMLQATLDGEWSDVEWAGGIEHLPGEKQIRRIYGRLEGMHNWPAPRMPSLEEILINQFGKTSFYSIAFPLLAGMLLANAELPKEIRQPTEAFGAAFGCAFQINDDLLVTAADVSGKSALADLARSSKTVVTVSVYELLPAREKRRWLKLLEQCKNSERARDEALRVIERSGVRGHCTNLIAADLDRCRSAITALESTGCWTGLLDYLVREGVAWMDDARVNPLEKGHA